MIRVGLYRLFLKLRIHPVKKIQAKEISGVFFYQTNQKLNFSLENIISLEQLKCGFSPFSGDYIFFDNETPNWHKNYFNNQVSKYKNIDWWDIPDFDPQLGDIKIVWELSRFEWVVQLALIASTGDDNAIKLLNERLNYWIQENKLYKGVNWKCGQEASIRVMHLIIAAIILSQLEKPIIALVELVEIHVKRIAPTISYAIGQNNNHGTSEAAALFVGGNFLTSNGLTQYNFFEKVGRKWLENRAYKLFSDDGCFSQYSINYHRLALDTYCFCENYRLLKELSPFSPQLYNKIKKATLWLESLTDTNTGDVPNIGANDGARLFNFFNFEYRDFRPTVQWANLLYNNKTIYDVSENQNTLFKKLGINIEFANKSLPVDSIQFMGKNDGFFIHKKNSLLLVLRRPIFKFRPSHADALHVDLWLNGLNIFRDGGSFSYNTDEDKIQYYTGTFSHNTVVIDSRNQMKKISRFLFGFWLKEKWFKYTKSTNEIYIKSGYKDNYGATHIRSLTIKDNFIQINDFVDGFKETANLIFRLPEKSWIMNPNSNDNSIEINLNSFTISGNFNTRLNFESRYYNQESRIPTISKDLVNKIQFTTNLIY